ncbi:MAG: hypothetical protein A3B74_00505 [Candidatus Kerfeldbacteria bacterium RIFCSPHIGHO2_02_FULL_42_14]|uniref:HTH cro/C1-type domain-containing protein n=1 Tax=Candidatus Kerfeldbacteria bacterium RIFCSPHIGHO2_02_FULL_42_14 TaxID=1798540 RepID=A0A1G2AS50_9BACT|nr:MAG: hypothetical protein A3B74_00505 [Candidatus Kerfeldbacteria bacterium RIFCSPHIGHO2_02_FULL_42_14]OGY81247.1 MAG: hypothetical protein A3E60_02235 [Candidatus Kerfeldbacteria bacterium RIFCSPHIGHO2_12_FULL_42_13]OGY83522.1 MAG: hypothetical protein A3I91_02670 [Candidatus Kerfeldbacteria bacterium RIFCSPLOWO2_02_FULL_42_19]OGY85765.1 MAG: hypothetical protein A3G01_03890 [Candidatus Kerfeldbacteria bacterium RIFCSPLOWO2_12_FULL_43_9]
MLKKGLGRGLESLIPKLPKSNISTLTLQRDSIVSKDQIAHIATHSISRNPHQPRTHFSPETLEELKNSIKEHGILMPLTVTRQADGGYELIAGERRLRAAQELKMQTVPAIVRSASELEKLELALIENIQRQDLNAIEEAAAYRKFIDDFGLTQDQVAKKVGKSRSQIANMLRYLQLPTEIQKGLADGMVSEGHVKVILGLKNTEDQLAFYRKIAKQKLSVRDTEIEIRKVKVGSFTRRLVVDPDLQSKKEALEKALGTKVIIEQRKGIGRIVVHFYSPEELGSLVHIITKL